VNAGQSREEVIFEIRRIGAYQRVAAIHVSTGTEVVIQAPANAALHDVRALALAKLERALKGDATPPSNRRGGTIV
jgi:hypothetical protein